MPLPAGNTAWPPAELAEITPKIAEWDAWWTGDSTKLERAYTGTGRHGTAVNRVRPSQRAGGVIGAVSRFFWGRPATDLTKADAPRLHVPLAADIAQASADLLFADEPLFTSEHAATQEALDAYIEDGLVSVLAQAAEVGAALGPTYLRVCWDTSISTRPFLDSVDADAAWPEFRHGRLTACTFWWRVKGDGSRVWRHLERHELDTQGNGVILHGLYEGDDKNLGSPRPLTDIPALQGIADALDADQVINTSTPGLAVVHIPNQMPARTWRNDPVGRHLGRSDLDGIEPMLDALDEAWSSMMWDLRAGKGRILAADSVLDDNGPGAGASFDVDRAVFTPLNVLQGREQSGLPIEVVQFAMRIDDHAKVIAELVTQILRTAGYSASTFGDHGDGVATATEIKSREKRSLLTRDRKLRAWRPAVVRILRKLAAVDAALMSAGTLEPDTIRVAFADAVQETPLELAQVGAAWRAAQAASTGTIVAYMHPDWDKEQVDTEVRDILAEQAGQAVPDPLTTLPAGA